MKPQAYRPREDLLRERVVLVTGASDGIGRALSLRVAELGGRVVLHGRNQAGLEDVYDEIERIDGALRPSIAVMDLASAEAAAYTAFAERLEAEFGRLDGLVHNAGILGSRQPLEQYDAGEWQRVLHVNLTAPFALTQVLLPSLHRAEDPSVIFTSSGVGREGRPYWGAYSVSKFGTEALMQILAAEQKHRGLRVNCVNPGPTRTKMRRAAYPAEDRERLKRPAEVLAPYLYLLGADAAGVTGQSLDAQPPPPSPA